MSNASCATISVIGIVWGLFLTPAPAVTISCVLYCPMDKPAMLAVRVMLVGDVPESGAALSQPTAGFSVAVHATALPVLPTLTERVGGFAPPTFAIQVTVAGAT